MFDAGGFLNLLVYNLTLDWLNKPRFEDIYLSVPEIRSEFYGGSAPSQLWSP